MHTYMFMYVRALSVHACLHTAINYYVCVYILCIYGCTHVSTRAYVCIMCVCACARVHECVYLCKVRLALRTYLHYACMHVGHMHYVGMHE